MATARFEQDLGHMAIATGTEQPTLLRRLLITCPATGLPTDTGFGLSAVPSVAGARQLLVDCLECGQDHEWSLDDVVVDRPIGLAEARAGTSS